MKDFTIKVPENKVKSYQEDIFYTHPENVKPIKKNVF